MRLLVLKVAQNGVLQISNQQEQNQVDSARRLQFILNLLS